MTAAFFPDTTVLINFEIISRWDVLSNLVKGRAQWVASVEDECRKWVSDYPNIRTSAAEIFGTAIRPEPAELINIRITRDEMANPADDHRFKHLGEAETIVIVKARFHGSRFITDDNGAYAAAKAQGIKCFGTGDLLLAAEKIGLITSEQRAVDLETLRINDRFPRSYYQ